MVVNPITNRPITFGGKTYKKLLKDGILKSIAPDENVLYSINESDDVDALKDTFKNKLKYGETAVKGRKGTSYENKIVRRKVQPKPDAVIKASASAISNNTEYNSLELEEMILAELFGTPLHIKRQATKAKSKPKKVSYSKTKVESDEDEQIVFSESEKDEEEEEISD